MDAELHNWGILGHAKQIRALETDLKEGNLAHAYLFAGPSQVGKYTIAKKLALMLQCDEHGCGTCTVCLNVTKGYHPDTIEMADGEAATSDDDEDTTGASIKIEPMRDTLARLFTTTPGKYKIFLVKNIERMTPEAANALLKTLEEPPSKVIFLFTSSAPESLLPTIASRVRMMKFNKVSDQEIFDFLNGKFPLEPEEKLRAIADFSMGLPGRATMLMNDPEHFERIRGLFEKMSAVLKNDDIVEKFAMVAEAAKSEGLFGDFFDILLLALRYTMLDEAVNDGSREKLRRTLRALQQAQEAVRLQKRNVNARLLFEHLMLQT